MLERLPVRWRLALTSAVLTFVILCGFAVVIGQLTANRIRSDFNNELAAAVDDLSDRLVITNLTASGSYQVGGPALDDYGGASNAAIRVLDPSGQIREQTRGAPNFGLRPGRSAQIGDFRVETRERQIEILTPNGRKTRFSIPLTVQYARPVSDIERTVARVRIFLRAGRARRDRAGARAPGCGSPRRAMAPITALTATARRIEETRDPTMRVPVPAHRRRDRRAGPDAGRHARTRSTRPARRPRRPSPASASSSPTPRTSCARR